MIEVVAISLWSHLFCGPWSEPEKVFGWLKAWAYKALPRWAYTPFIGCAMCHAVWVAIGWNAWCVWRGEEFGAGTLISIFCSSFFSDLLNDFKSWRESQINK